MFIGYIYISQFFYSFMRMSNCNHVLNLGEDYISSFNIKEEETQKYRLYLHSISL